MKLQLHITGEFESVDAVQSALAATIHDIGYSLKMVDTDPEAFQEPIIIDLEREDFYHLEGLLGVDILFDPAQDDEPLGLGVPRNGKAERLPL